MLEVREQATLSFRRMLAICLDSISYRLLRSFVTVLIITLAIAFLSTIMFQGYLGRSMRDAAIEQTAKITSYSRFLSNAGLVASNEKLVNSFAEMTSDSARYRNVKRWGEFSDEELVRFIAQSDRARRYLSFFQAMPVGRRVLLVGRFQGLQIFDALRDKDAFARFRERLLQMKSLRLPGGIESFQTFLEDWPDYRRRFDRVRRSYSGTVERIARFAQPEGLREKLETAVREDRTDGFFRKLDDLGLHVDPQRIPAIIGGVRYQQRLDEAFSHLRKQPVQAGWNREFKEKFSPGDALRSVAEHPSRIDWIARTLRENDVAAGFDPEAFREVAEDYRRQSRLLEAREKLQIRYGRTEKLSEKTVWLISVSFLVCIVGIANAMLMSVLERFKEIATMKCLGARNETIRFLFITESMIIGVVGGIVGMVLGLIVAIARQLPAYPMLVFDGFPFGDLFTTFWICAVCSLVLAAVAAIFPSGVAARMAPMEAMRVD